MEKKLIINPTTLGEKLRSRRIELGLLQKDMALIFGVCEDSITGWENDRNEPSVVYYPNIIRFLGYMPFNIDASTLGGRIKLYRYVNGLSQEALALSLHINESTIFNYENGVHTPSPSILKKILLMM